MLEKVTLEPKYLSNYNAIVGNETIEHILTLAEPLNGARVLHINATAFGGGVAEILVALVPLMRDIGLEAEWQVIQGSDEFFRVTKASHNGLQGMDLPFTDEMKEIWKKYNEINGKALEGEFDYIIVHDPQPAGILHYHGHTGGRYWIWRCHIDTSQPNPTFWDFYAPYFSEYDSTIFTLPDYVGPDTHFDNLAIITPTIDPLSNKNRLIQPEEARSVVSSFGIDISRPLITQVSRYDPWKDPLGVIDSYRIVKESIPALQLALVGSMAADDPEGWYFLDKTTRHAGEDDDIYILHNFLGVGGYEVGCFQTVSDVIIQKSIREGFGLVVTEALWKGRPVVGGNVGGIPIQVIDGKTGYLVDTVQDCAQRTLELLENPALIKKMGEAGREHVRENFLITQHLKNYLDLFNTLAAGD